nr:hypothetical protein [uncultured Gellertiella sp.]
MTVIYSCEERQTALLPSIRPLVASLFAAANHVVTGLVARWQDYQTERALEAMPPGLRKDLGWPANDTRR